MNWWNTSRGRIFRPAALSRARNRSVRSLRPAREKSSSAASVRSWKARPDLRSSWVRSLMKSSNHSWSKRFPIFLCPSRSTALSMLPMNREGTDFASSSNARRMPIANRSWIIFTRIRIFRSTIPTTMSQSSIISRFWCLCRQRLMPLSSTAAMSS